MRFCCTPAAARTHLVVAGLFFFCSMLPLVQAGPPGGSASWSKSWYDEFNGASIDTGKWSIGAYPWGSRDLTGGPGAPNYAASYGQDADSYLSGGNLVLRCRTNDFLPTSTTTRPYTHGLVHTAAGYDQSKWWKYGYFEIRGNYPGGSKVWPAFWMLGDGWPPEFDIAEYFGSDQRMHMGYYYGSWDSTSYYNSSEGFEGNWHTYSLEWGPGYAIWRKDGTVKKSVYSSNIPDVPMYVLINSGMRNVTDNHPTPLPNYFYVDYFRKYDPPLVTINDSTTGTGLNQCRYVGTWDTVTADNRLFFNDRHYSSSGRAYVEVPFEGSRIDVYGWKSTSQGIAAFSVDGGPSVSVDFYSGDFASKLVWSATGLVPGYHTLKMSVTGTKNSSSSGTDVSLDRIDTWDVPPCLKGTLLGTSGSSGGGDNTKENAVDGNLETYFSGPDTSGDWVGWDLGATPRRITSVLYCPRTGYALQMLGGKFQGANLSDFSDAVDLFTVPGEPDELTMTTQTIGDTNGYRYVRYLGPSGSSCNVGEIEFYGTEVGAGNGTWSADSDGTWSTASKWSADTIATGAGFTANFSTLNIGGDRTVTLDSSRSIGTLWFGDISGAQTWTLVASGGSELTLDSGTLASPSIVVNQNTATIDLPLVGANGFTKSGAGTLVLGANNPLSGPLYLDRGSDGNNDDGATRIAYPYAVANVTSLNIRNTSVSSAGYGAVLQLDGSSGNIFIPQPMSVSCRNNDDATIQNLSGTNTLSGTISLNVGGNRFNIRSDAGLLVISGPNQYVGSLIGGRSYAFSGAGNHLVSGPILNSTNGAPISLTKSGTGTLTLAGNNTYASTTTVSGGALLVNGSTASSSAVTVANTGTLGGTGTIGSSVTVLAGGTMSPGASIGTLTVGGNVVLQPGSATVMEINKSLLNGDVLHVNGSLTYGGGLVVTNLAGNLTAGDSFHLFEAPSTSGSFASTNLPPLGTGLEWDLTQLTNGVLSVVAVVPPQIAAATRLNDGVFQVQGSGAAWATYELQSASNLLAPILWFPVTNTPADGNGLFELMDDDATNHSQRFYRVAGP